jgi:outer membrane beta-barrel protein
MNWKTLTLCSAVVLTMSTTALGDEGGDAALVEKVAVRNRIFNVAGRWELGGNVGFTLLSRLTDTYNLNVSGAYNITDWLGVELRGGYAISGLTSLAKQIQSDFAINSSISTANDMADLWQMTANAVVGARFQPIYGKINLVAELPIHFQFYVWAGGGFGVFRHQSLALCVEKSGTTCNSYLTETKGGPLVSVALGFRFFFATSAPIPGEKAVGQHSIKFEARDYSYLDSYYVNVVRADATASNPTAGGRLSPNAGITNLAQFDIGYSYIF